MNPEELAELIKQAKAKGFEYDPKTKEFIQTKPVLEMFGQLKPSIDSTADPQLSTSVVEALGSGAMGALSGTLFNLPELSESFRSIRDENPSAFRTGDLLSGLVPYSAMAKGVQGLGKAGQALAKALNVYDKTPATIQMPAEFAVREFAQEGGEVTPNLIAGAPITGGLGLLVDALTRGRGDARTFEKLMPKNIEGKEKVAGATKEIPLGLRPQSSLAKIPESVYAAEYLGTKLGRTDDLSRFLIEAQDVVNNKELDLIGNAYKDEFFTKIDDEIVPVNFAEFFKKDPQEAINELRKQKTYILSKEYDEVLNREKPFLDEIELSEWNTIKDKYPKVKSEIRGLEQSPVYREQILEGQYPTQIIKTVHSTFSERTLEGIDSATRETSKKHAIKLKEFLDDVTGGQITKLDEEYESIAKSTKDFTNFIKRTEDVIGNSSSTSSASAKILNNASAKNAFRRYASKKGIDADQFFKDLQKYKQEQRILKSVWGNSSTALRQQSKDMIDEETGVLANALGAITSPMATLNRQLNNVIRNLTLSKEQKNTILDALLATGTNAESLIQRGIEGKPVGRVLETGRGIARTELPRLMASLNN